jgi:hypothetical protein
VFLASFTLLCSIDFIGNKKRLSHLFSAWAAESAKEERQKCAVVVSTFSGSALSARPCGRFTAYFRFAVFAVSASFARDSLLISEKV